jgi:hypothetical protein
MDYVLFPYRITIYANHHVHDDGPLYSKHVNLHEVAWNSALYSYVAMRHEDLSWNWSISPSFFTSALDGGEWSVSGFGRFNPGERALGTIR